MPLKQLYRSATKRQKSSPRCQTERQEMGRRESKFQTCAITREEERSQAANRQRTHRTILISFLAHSLQKLWKSAIQKRVKGEYYIALALAQPHIWVDKLTSASNFRNSKKIQIQADSIQRPDRVVAKLKKSLRKSNNRDSCWKIRKKSQQKNDTIRVDQQIYANRQRDKHSRCNTPSKTATIESIKLRNRIAKQNIKRIRTGLGLQGTIFSSLDSKSSPSVLPESWTCV